MSDQISHQKSDYADDWNRESLGARMAKSIAVPVTASIVVFTVCVGVAIALVMFKPQVITNDDTFLSSKDEVNVNIDETGATTPPADLNLKQESESKSLFVHVTGQVKKPGVVELESGARVNDAITKAGGVEETAALDAVNLARIVIDGEQIFVPHIDDALELNSQRLEGFGNAESASGIPTVININTADQATLETLPRIGPALASRIIEWRESNGGFQSVEDLINVSGVGPKLYANLKDRVSV